MASVYSNSYLNIAASGAKDNTEGIFQARHKTYFEFAHITEDGLEGRVLVSSMPPWHACLPHQRSELRDEPLNSRGWALQERLLAPRILHFASDQVYFECNEGSISEDGAKIESRWGGIPVINPTRGDPRGLGSWAGVVWSYTLRHLTKPSDRLPALSGLAKQYQEILDDEYVAGLWKKSLLQGGLLWQAVGGARDCKPTAVYRAPSWSWACLDGLVGLTFEEEWEEHWPLASVVEVHVDLKGQNPFGEVLGGFLKISAPKVKLMVSEKPEHDHETVPHARSVRLTTEGGDAYGVYALLDTIDDTDPEKVQDLKNMELFLIAILKYKCSDGKDIGYQGLIVTTVENQRDTFRRIGVLIFDDHTLRDASVVEGSDFVEVVTLI
jgi:hypothetical protein